MKKYRVQVKRFTVWATVHSVDDFELAMAFVYGWCEEKARMSVPSRAIRVVTTGNSVLLNLSPFDQDLIGQRLLANLPTEDET